MADEPEQPAAKPTPPQETTTTTTTEYYKPGRRAPHPSGGQAFIIGCMAVAILDTTVTDLRKSSNKSPAMKIILGGFIVTVTLLVVSDSQPELAESMALLIMLATLFGPNGNALTDLITKLTTNPTKVGNQVAAAAHKGATTTSGTNVIES